MAIARTSKHARLDLRVTPAQAAVIRAAARGAGRTVTDFVIETAVEAAERILADQTEFVLNDADWQRFNEILDRPAADKPRLTALLQSTDRPPA